MNHMNGNLEWAATISFPKKKDNLQIDNLGINVQQVKVIYIHSIQSNTFKFIVPRRANKTWGEYGEKNCGYA